MSPREAVSFILVVAALFALLPMPGSVGQSLTTIVETVTTLVVTVDTINSTVATTQSRITVSQTEAYSTPFVVQPTQGMYSCVYHALRFAASGGEAISVAVKSSIPISFYIMTADDYQAWVAGNSCAAASSVLYSRQQVSTTFVDMIAPSTGYYDLVFLNFSLSNSANVNVNFQGVSQGLTTISVPVVTRFPVNETYIATSTLTEVQTVVATEPFQQYVIFTVPLIFALTLVFIALRRRSSKKTAGIGTVAAKQAAPIGGKFCGDCGKSIPMEAKFCPECGSSTEES